MGVMERSGRIRQSRCERGKWLTLRQVASLHRIPVEKIKSGTITVDLFIKQIYLARLTQQVVECLLSGV